MDKDFDEGQTKQADIQQWLQDVRAARLVSPEPEEVQDRGLTSNPSLPSPSIILPPPTSHLPLTHQHPHTDRHTKLTSNTTPIQPSIARLSQPRSIVRTRVGSLDSIHRQLPPFASSVQPHSAARTQLQREKLSGQEEGTTVCHQLTLQRNKSLSPLPEPIPTLGLPSFTFRVSPDKGSEKRPRRPLVSSTSLFNSPLTLRSSSPKTRLTAPSKSFPLCITVTKSAPVSPDLSSVRKQFQHQDPKEPGPNGSPRTLTRQKISYSEDDLALLDKFIHPLSTSTSTSGGSSPIVGSSSEGRRSMEEDVPFRNIDSPWEKQASKSPERRDNPESPGLSAIRHALSEVPAIQTIPLQAMQSRVEEPCQKEESGILTSADTSLFSAPANFPPPLAHPPPASVGLQSPSLISPTALSSPFSPPVQPGEGAGSGRKEEGPGRKRDGNFKHRLRELALESFSFDNEGLLPTTQRHVKFLSKKWSPPPSLTHPHPSNHQEPLHSHPSHSSQRRRKSSSDLNESLGSSSTSYPSGSSGGYRRGSLMTESVVQKATRTPSGSTYMEVDRMYKSQSQLQLGTGGVSPGNVGRGSPASQPLPLLSPPLPHLQQLGQPGPSLTYLSSPLSAPHPSTLSVSSHPAHSEDKLDNRFSYADTSPSRQGHLLAKTNTGHVESSAGFAGKDCLNRQDSGVGTLSTVSARY